MQDTLDKGPFIHLEKHIIKYNKRHNLLAIVDQTHQQHKWLENKDIDKILSKNLWKNSVVTNKTKYLPNQISNRAIHGPHPKLTLPW